MKIYEWIKLGWSGVWIESGNGVGWCEFAREYGFHYNYQILICKSNTNTFITPIAIHSNDRIFIFILSSPMKFAFRCTCIVQITVQVERLASRCCARGDKENVWHSCTITMSN